MRGQEFFDGCLMLANQADLIQASLDLPATPGVGLFAAANDQPLLLLAGADLRSLVRRRLSDPRPEQRSRRTALRPLVARIWFRRTFSAFETRCAYYHIARAVYPDTYGDLLGRLEAWVLHVQPDDHYPVFSSLRADHLATGRAWGPFATRQAAAACLQALQDVFDLCRCPDRLGRPDRAAACPYAQMGRCAAVCRDADAAEPYRRLIAEAIDLLDRPFADVEQELRQQMHACAARLEFERAARCKRQLKLVRQLLSPSCRWVLPLEQWYIFSFQTGPVARTPGQPACRTVTPFLIHPAGIDQLEPARLDQAQQTVQAISDHYHLRRLQQTGPEPVRPDAELLAWVAHLLYRSPDPRALLLPARQAPDPSVLAEDIRRCLTTPAARRRRPLDSFSPSGQNSLGPDGKTDPPPPDTPAPNDKEYLP